MEHRVALLQLAVAPHPAFSVSRCEADSGRPMFTIETLRALRRVYEPETRLVLLLGWDAWRDLPGWQESAAVRQLAEVAVAPRPGHDDEPLDGARLIPAPPLAISSSDIRTRIARHDDISDLVPGPVAAYIHRHGLYRDD